ncbi:Rho guanine nucleotide exchange factor 11, partial [Frankliniella fusca]
MAQDESGPERACPCLHQAPLSVSSIVILISFGILIAMDKHIRRRCSSALLFGAARRRCSSALLVGAALRRCSSALNVGAALRRCSSALLVGGALRRCSSALL